MKFKAQTIHEVPLYVFAELLMRLKEMKAELGDYRTVNKTSDGYILYTTEGMIEIPLHMLKTQFEHPSEIESERLKSLLRHFRQYV